MCRARVGAQKWIFKDLFVLPLLVLLLLEVGLDQVPFRCPLQPQTSWDSVVLGSLRMGFSVFLPFPSHPEHPREAAPQGWGL